MSRAITRNAQLNDAFEGRRHCNRQPFGLPVVAKDVSSVQGPGRVRAIDHSRTTPLSRDAFKTCGYDSTAILILSTIPPTFVSPQDIELAAEEGAARSVTKPRSPPFAPKAGKPAPVFVTNLSCSVTQHVDRSGKQRVMPQRH